MIAAAPRACATGVRRPSKSFDVDKRVTPTMPPIGQPALASFGRSVFELVRKHAADGPVALGVVLEDDVEARAGQPTTSTVASVKRRAKSAFCSRVWSAESLTSIMGMMCPLS